MESQPQNPEFRNNPESFYQMKMLIFSYPSVLTCFRCLKEMSLLKRFF